MESININLYEDEDFEAEISLIVDTFSSKFNHNQNLNLQDIKAILCSLWNTKANDPHYLHLIAKKNNTVVGALLIRLKNSKSRLQSFSFIKLAQCYGYKNIFRLFMQLLVLDLFDPKECYIEHLAVSSSIRGKGIGSSLISHAENKLKLMNFKFLTLVVAKENEARLLYEKTGFCESERFSSKIIRHFIGIKDWIFMQKEL